LFNFFNSIKICKIKTNDNSILEGTSVESTVLYYIKKDNKYLMLFRNKKENDLNEGKYMGIGGHIENDETPTDAVIREVKEETGLDLLSVKERGYILFINDDYQEEMYVFTSDSFKGELIECNEGELFWIDIDKVYDLPAWEGDKVFLDKLLKDEKYFNLELIYSKDKLIKVIEK